MTYTYYVLWLLLLNPEGAAPIPTPIATYIDKRECETVAVSLATFSTVNLIAATCRTVTRR
jgi:hypothetical protein